MIIISNENKYGHCKRGKYDVNGTEIFFRSEWEYKYAMYLDFLKRKKQIVCWEYEPCTFFFEAIKQGTRSYLPDFRITNNDKSQEYHEIKGYMDSKSKTKLNRMKKYYPCEKVILIDGPAYKSIMRYENVYGI